MYKNKIIAVVIPAYNEENLIGRVIETIPRFVDKIIVVDDASIDKTQVDYSGASKLIQKGNINHS